MKLDLINSRLHVDLGPRIYDSIEGEFIQPPPKKPKTIFRASFVNKQKRLDYEPKTEKVPDRFNLAVVDSHGSYLPLDKTKRFRPKQAVSTIHQPTFAEMQEIAKKESPDPFGLESYPSKIADYLKDHVYDVKEDTVKRRLESGKLPGGVWDATGRKHTPPKYTIGPGDYEVYDSNLTRHGPMQQLGGQFNNQPSGREIGEEMDPNFLPWKERQRYQRRKEKEDEKLAKVMRSISPPKNVSLLDSVGSMTLSSADDADGAASGGLIKSPGKKTVSSLGGTGTKSRFDDKIYKQEFFVKTSGMKLSQDWDKKLIKKIPFSFQPPSHKAPKSPVKANSADVDVDVGHMFSIVRTAALSPIKYSAAFRSNAPVGMEIPVPTSGTEIGPGSFPGAFAQTLVVKQPDRPSHFILRGRPDDTRTPLPDLTEPILSFSERHRAGPTFEKQVVGGGNIVLQEIVKQKMKKIYPDLAKAKFPPPPPSEVPSPWKKKKRK